MAIQVNGTQVIGNSRELTNIASIDATTATAIGNAGVGGATTLITGDTAISGTALTLSLSSTYDVHVIQLGQMTHTGANNSQQFWLRMGNSSGTTLTNSYDYTWQYLGSSAFQQVNDYSAVFRGSQWFSITSSLYGVLNATITIYNAAKSNEVTTVVAQSMCGYYTSATAGGGPEGATYIMQMNPRSSNLVNANVTLFPQYAAQQTGWSGRYKMWGINL